MMSGQEQDPYPPERMLSLGAVPRYLAKRGLRSRRNKPLHISTVHRWVSRGVSGVRLRSWKIGRTRVTSESALAQFIASQSLDGSAGGFENPAPSATDRRALRAASEARRILAGKRGAA